MRTHLVTRLTAVSVAAAALTASANASAHYYAQLLAQVDNGHADDGASIDLWTNILHSTCNILTHEFATHELWYGVQGDGAYWVEVGFFDGATDGLGCKTQDVFWADNRNGGGYNEHDTGWILSPGSWIPLGVYFYTGCEWNVWWDNTNIGSSTANCPGSGRSLQAGIETTSQTTGSVKGWSSDWMECEDSILGNQCQQQWDNKYICQSYGDGNCTSGNPQIQWQWGNTGTEEVLNEGF